MVQLKSLLIQSWSLSYLATSHVSSTLKTNLLWTVLECRGSKGRSVWYFFHWLLGTTICLAGIINTYTGLNAYHERTSKPISLWTIIFTAQISFMGFFYLFQDKWEYIQKQGAILENNETMTPQVEIVVPQSGEQKMIMRTESGRKSNALGTFFSRSNVLNKLLQQT